MSRLNVCLLVVASFFATGECFAEATIWEPGSPITVTIESVPEMVKPKESIFIVATATDADIWTKYDDLSGSEGAMRGGNVLDAGSAADTCRGGWTKTGGEWGSKPSALYVVWKAPKEPGIYTLTIDVDDAAPPVDLGTRNDPPTTTSVTIEVIEPEIQILRIEAPEPAKARVYCQSNVVLDSVSLSGPGAGSKLNDVGIGEFSLPFDQTKLPIGGFHRFTVEAIVKEKPLSKSFSARREDITSERAQTILLVHYLDGVRGTPFLLPPTPYLHELTEIYHRVNYSVPLNGKGLWVGSSHASLALGKIDFPRVVTSESHSYNFGQNSQMTLPVGPYIGLQHTVYWRSSTDAWSSLPAVGTAKTDRLLRRGNGGLTFGHILNDKVQQDLF